MSIQLLRDSAASPPLDCRTASDSLEGGNDDSYANISSGEFLLTQPIHILYDSKENLHS